MKKILFLIVLMLGLVSCGTPKEVALPNKNLKNENGVVTYKGKPYTGKLKANLADKVQGYNGSLSFKDGHFEGLSEIKSDKQKMHVKFSITNGKFDGEVISKMPQMGEALINFKDGKIVSEKSSFINGVDADLTYSPEGVVNGTMKINGQTLNFKDGEAQFGPGKMIVKIDYEKQILTMTVMQGTTEVQKVEQPVLTVDMFEKMLFPILTQQ